MILEESKLRIGLSLSAPVMLAFLAIVVWLGELDFWVTGLIGGVAALLAWFVLFDFAMSVSIDDTGITRRCLARSQAIEWSDVDRIMNPRRRGIVVVTDAGRLHILIDRKLDQTELEQLAARARRHGIEFKR